MKLSALVPTFNEEKRIAACLESLSFCDEIILVDSHSTDRTVEIAHRYTDRIFVRPWSGSNSQKDFARQNARGEWVLSVDADEVVSDVLRDEVLARVASPSASPAGYELPIRTYLADRWVKVGGLWPGYHLRFFRRQQGRWDSLVEPHEHVSIDGKIGRLRGHLLHYSYDDLQDFLDKAERHARIWAETKYRAGGKAGAMALLLRPTFRFFRDYFLRGGFLGGRFGLFFCGLQAHYTFLKYVKLWDLSSRSRALPPR